MKCERFEIRVGPVTGGLTLREEGITATVMVGTRPEFIIKTWPQIHEMLAAELPATCEACHQVLRENEKDLCSDCHRVQCADKDKEEAPVAT